MRRETLFVMRQLGILAKYWEPGRVKTRLATTEGVDQAAALHRAFLKCLLRRFSDAADRHVLAFTPDERQADFASLAGPAWHLEQQKAGDLGVRMRCHFQAGFAAGSDQVILVGADSPSLPESFVSQAFSMLEVYPVVLGPAADGGYYLIGAADEVPDIFDKITWSSGEVLQQTIDRLDAAGMSYAQLPAWYDVDDQQSLDKLRNELAAMSGVERHLATLREEVDRIKTAGG